MNRIYTILLLLLVPLISLAQQLPTDFLVKASGDTVRGKFRNISQQGRPNVVLQAGTEELTFPAAEVASYGEVNGRVFVRRQRGRQGQAVFVQSLIQGYVSLYASADEEPTRFFLQPRDSSYVIEVVPVSAQLTFHRLLGDCPSLRFGTDEIRRRYPYTYAGLRSLVADYNNCRMPAQAVQATNPSGGWKMRWGLKAGAHRSTFTEYENVLDRSFNEQSTGFQLGGLLHFKNRSQFSLQVEAVLLRLHGLSTPADVFNSNYLYKETSGVETTFYQLQVPFLVGYRLGNGRLQPYLNAGPSLGFNMGRTTELTYHYRYVNRVEVQVISQHKPDPISLGLSSGLGVLLSPAAGPAFTVEARLDYMIDQMRNSYFRPRHTSLRLDLGVMF